LSFFPPVTTGALEANGTQNRTIIKTLARSIAAATCYQAFFVIGSLSYHRYYYFLKDFTPFTPF